MSCNLLHGRAQVAELTSLVVFLDEAGFSDARTYVRNCQSRRTETGARRPKLPWRSAPSSSGQDSGFSSRQREFDSRRGYFGARLASASVYPEIHIGPLTLQTFGLVRVRLHRRRRGDRRRLGELGKPVDWAYEMTSPRWSAASSARASTSSSRTTTTSSDDLLGNLFSGSGLVWYGGAIGGAIGGRPLGLVARVPQPRLLDLARPRWPSATRSAACGCQLSGDGDYGKAWDGPWAMAYPDGTKPTDRPSTRRRSTRRSRWAWSPRALAPARPLPPGLLFALYLLLAGTERFLVEFIRRNDDVALGLTQAQLLSLAMMLAGGVWLAWSQPRQADAGARRAPPTRPTEPDQPSLERAEQAAVERDHGAGEIGGPLRAQEGDQVAVLLRRAEPAGRNVGAGPAPRPPRASPWVGQALGRERAGGDRVDRDAVAGHLVRERLEEPDRRHPVGVRERRPGIGSRIELEETLTIRPQPRSRIPGKHGLDQHPRRQHQRAEGRLPLLESSCRAPRPAAARRCCVTRISTGPSASATSPGSAAIRSRSPVSAGRTATSPSISAAAASSSSGERLAIATRAPSRASAAAIPRPIPRLAR